MGDSKETHGIPQFKGEGFDDWQFRVKTHLDSLNLLDVLTGNPPTEAAALREYLKMDKKAKDKIVSFIHSDCLSFVRDKETANEMWCSLKAAFASKSVIKQLLLRKQLAKLKMNDGDSIVSHILAFENLVRQLEMSGATMDKSDVIAQLFLTLPEKYDPLVTALQNVDDNKLNLNLVKQRLMSEEAKLSDRSDEVAGNVTAFSSKKFPKKKKFNGKCFKCNKFGHKSKDCWKGEAHVTKIKAVSFMVRRNESMNKIKGSKIVFKIDSGASDHMANDKSCFSVMKELHSPVEITVAKDSESMLAHHVGEIRGYTNKNVEFYMKDVLFTPDLRDNLISVRKLTTAGLVVNFINNTASILRGNEKLATAYLRGCLYELKLDCGTRSALSCTKSDVELWHKRLGHIGISGFEKLQKLQMLKRELNPRELNFCDVCAEAKLCRSPFNGIRPKSKRVLQRIHSDVCGPITPTAWNGSKYFVSFIDDFTHFAIIYCIKKKSEVFEKFQEYEALVSAMFPESKISTLTVDQGREYMSRDQQVWYKRKGIQVQSTVAYTPQQNGVSERFNRTVSEKIRSMLIESNVPKYLWNEASLAAVYIINRCSTRALDENVTPAELWYREKPSLTKIKIFGCKAYAWVPDAKRKKLDDRGKKMVMVGYAPNGFRLWNMETQRIVLVRDVKFDEMCFPFKMNQQINNTVKNIISSSHEQEEEGADSVAVSECVDDVERCEHSDEISETSGAEYVSPEPSVDNEADEDLPSPYMEAESVLITSDESAGEDEQPCNEVSETEGQLRRSSRISRLPSKLYDYITGFNAEVVKNNIPENYADIFNRDDTAHWKKAVVDELESMEKNKVWDLVKAPPNIKPLKSKWVFRIKEDVNGIPTKYKARLVVKGFLQKYGVDYWETYAPVAKLTTLRIMLAVGVYRNYRFHQLDVKTAFLYAKLKENIYMVLPEGINGRPDMCCKLKKSLYGLKQAPKCWNDEFNSFLISLGFSRSKHDYCLYVKMDKKKLDVLYLLLYVDDVLIVGSKLESINKLKAVLGSKFEMSDCGPLEFFLGMKLIKDGCNLTISQEISINKVLQKFGMAECNPVKSPMEKGLKLKVNTNNQCLNKPYRELLGSMMYIMLCSRPDICYHISYLGRFQQNPTEEHWQHLKRILRYLKGTSSLKLNYTKRDAEPITGYADADWASDLSDRKSISGYLFKVYGCTVSWCSKKQQTVSTSSSEAEYVALSLATTEAIWLKGVMYDLKEVDNNYTITIYEDNRGCIGIANNLENKRVKHIDIKHHFVRDNVANGSIKIKSISTQNQLADIFTKSTDSSRLIKICKEIGLND